MKRLTQNFTLDEFIRSSTAKRLNIDNTPSDEVVSNLRALCENVLQRVRDFVGAPIRINSGYRSEKLNKAVGGKPNSQHLKGEAADIVPMDGNISVYELFNTIKKMTEMGIITVDQCIYEISHEVDWIHVSYTNRRPNRNMFIELNV
jgi:uncharacterized protein YcbK (DUF882 family)